MSKMKHLLRKLHIGDHHNRLGGETRPVSSSSTSASTTPSPSDGRIEAVESAAVDRTDVEAISGTDSTGIDFNLLEEEFQMQLALAISASDPDSIQDAESAQIDAAKRISLRSSPVVPVNDADSLAESLSLRYWSYSVVNYNEKVMDGFYDVCGVTSNSVIQGNMPFLADLQAISVSDDVDYEVIMVNRFVDAELRELERRAYIMSLESRFSDGLVSSGLIQKIADVVVDRMGGPVSDADEMSSRWKRRSKELQNALNSIILPLGCLDVGLSRHRALLFKVIADRINLPCMLVKGSYYTGTDDGAVNLIKIDDGSEYIIDLMGAPGTLIPPEVPSSHLPTAGFDISGFASLTETPEDSTPLMDQGYGILAFSPNLDVIPQAGTSTSGQGLFVSIKTNEDGVNLVEKNQIERFEHDFGKLSLSGTEKPSSAQKNRVKNVSKYVISAAKNPDFAQKLHAVLLESGASPPPNLFSDMNLGEPKLLEKVHPENGVNLDDRLRCCLDDMLTGCEQSLASLTRDDTLKNVRCDYKQEQFAEGSADELRRLMNVFNSDPSLPSDVISEGFVLVDNRTNEKLQTDSAVVDMVSINAPGMAGSSMHENPLHAFSLLSALEPCQLQPEHALVSSDSQCFQENMGRILSMDAGKESALKLIETANSGQHISCCGHSERINPMLGEVAEWEIPWEDLEIGERIGIGSYGEVYHGDWNGTEVAVKKFLDQDLSGDALVQFKCEAEIMLRLRHPNVVLFMGAVTRPPHLSILTEFLPRGSLYRLLHRPHSQVDEKRRMRMAIDVAKGMNYLHTSHPTIVHRDLKSPNLLVDKNWNVKVCDFGLSRIKHHTFLSSKSTAGTPEWMAPEVLRNEPANEKCDIYSFGVILWELATCQIPWKGLNPMQVVGAVGFQNRPIVGGGIEDELLQPQFSIGLKGVFEEDIQKVEELVMNTLKKLAEEGFETEAVEASMNTIEFSLRENNTGSFPRGLSLMLRSISKWIYDMNPFEPLKYEKPLMDLKARIAEEGYKAVFSPLIEKFILNNPHRVTVEMQPDPEKASHDEAAEREILEKVKASMTEEDLAELARATQELKLKQETPDPPEALRSVPSLFLCDIPKEPIHVPTEVGDINGVKVLKHDLFTNDVLYAEIVFNMRSLKQELLPLVPLFCQSLLEMGTKDLTFVQLNQLIGRKTGGLSVYPFTSSVRGREDPCSHIVARGKAMAGRVEDLFNLVNCVLQEVQFTDQQRFKQFVSQSKARMENRLRGSGHGIAAARMDAKLNVAGWISEQMGGVSYLEFLKALEKRVDQDWAGVSSSLEEIRMSLFSKNGCLINMTADGKNLTNSEKYVSKFLDLLPSKSSVEAAAWNARLSPGNEAIVIPTQVNYVGKAANIYDTGYQLNGSAYVISKYISNTWLWDRVRVSGGAYGGFCDFDTHSGVFSFLSYRDPNLLKTLDVYDGSGAFLRELEMDNDTLTKAIIGTIGDVDSYQLADAKGYSSLLRYLLGITEEERQKRREEILSTSLKDFKEFGEVIEAVKDKGVSVVVASPEDVHAANKERSNYFDVKKAL